MPLVRYRKLNLETEVPIGWSLLQASRKANAKHGCACGGVCACSTCHVYVHEGLELLSPMDDEEEDILDKAFDVRRNSRLGCQAKLLKDGVVEIELTEESLKAWEDEHG